MADARTLLSGEDFQFKQEVIPYKIVNTIAANGRIQYINFAAKIYSMSSATTEQSQIRTIFFKVKVKFLLPARGAPTDALPRPTPPRRLEHLHANFLRI